MKEPDAKPDGYETVWSELPTLLFVPLSQGKFSVIDSIDWPRISSLTWCADARPNGRYYARSPLGAMHRILRPSSKLIDHANGDGLDNRRKNLRPATPSQNSANAAWRAGIHLKGVCLSGRKTKPFRAKCRRGGKQVHIGIYKTVEEAAGAYDLFALRVYGEFAYLNFEYRRASYLKQIEAERQSA